MAKYEQYAKYKDSGVEWLGKIPTQWKVTALKRYCNVKGGYAFASDTFSNAGEPVIRIGDIKADGSISLEGCKFISTELAKSSHAYLVEKGQLLMAMTGATIGKAGVYINDRPAYLNQRVGKFVIDNDEMNYSFLWYTLKTNGYQEYIKLTAFGGAQPNISDTGMVDYISCFPSLSEQTQIANFLDHETAQIDTLIEKQKTLIQLLKEKRQAVISHAVTKGLNPDAPMKDSGVEWLGEVPEHWELPKLIHQTSKIGDGLHSTPQYQDGTGYYFVNGNNLVNGQIVVSTTSKEVPEDQYKKHYIYLDNSSVLLSINGTIGNVARYNNEMVILGKSAAYMNCADSLLPEYLMVLLQSSQAHYYFDLEVTGTTIYNLSLNSIRQMRICIPPKQEQSKIHKFCELQQNKYDTLIEKASTAIRLMQERRTALISAAVTGKIDVRGWVAPE